MRSALVFLPLLVLAGCLGATPDSEVAPGPTASQAKDGTDPPGATGGDPSPPSAEADRLGRSTPGMDGPPPIEVLRKPFHITVQGGKSSVANLIEEDALLDLAPSGATALVLELAWDSDVFDLDPNLIFDGGCDPLGDPAGCMVSSGSAHWLDEGDDGNYWVKDGSAGAPDSPVRLEVGTDALTSYGCDVGCSAFARAIVKDVAVDVSGELVVSIFRGTPVPAGYTALA